MTDTTTIEIRDTQKNQLDRLKTAPSESYKDVLQRLIDDYSGADQLDEARVREIVRDEVESVARGR